jgi:DNA-binding CsgD family transcriptional regulator
LTERTRASGTTSGLAVGAYAKALVSGVEDHYREAVERLDETNLRFYSGRAHLGYGEWLRGRGRREDCLHHLRVAHAMLSRSGAAAFAHRAAVELHALGDKVAQRQPDQLSGKLTVHELAVARLVTTGATSKQVAEQLFVSKRTVDAHLRNIFRKLGVTSRMQLQNHPDLFGRA